MMLFLGASKLYRRKKKCKEILGRRIEKELRMVSDFLNTALSKQERPSCFSLLDSQQGLILSLSGCIITFPE
jgi:hypothetical protein